MEQESFFIKESAIKQFGRQAKAYSKENKFVDGVHLSEVVKRSSIKKNHRVLDIATGTGFLALEFAKTAEMVIGSDLTRNMLLHACEKQRNSGCENTGFILSDVESLPFRSDAFDIVSCRFAFHHFPEPVKALHEMKRVCKSQGLIVLVDGVSSGDANKSLFHNRIEKLRDPSHVRIYTLNEIKSMFNTVEVIIVDIEHWDIPQDFDDWIHRAGTDEKKTKSIKDLMMQSMNDDRTGLRVKLKAGRIGFTYDTVIVTARGHK